MKPARLARVLGPSAILWAIAGPCAHAQSPPEPNTFRLQEYRAPTPATLEGASVIGTSEAEALWRKGGATFVDVMPQPERPANLPKGTLWNPPSRESIPGAVWLPNVGYGELAPVTEAYFRHGLALVSKGDAAHPLVFFCLKDCWMSWNAAKRALTYSYSAVYWYPEGTDGWIGAGLPVDAVKKFDTPKSL